MNTIKIIDVIRVIEDGLKQNGFDGLVDPGLCGCIIGDLSPGDCLHDKCRPGYKHTHSVTGEYVVSTQKDAITDDEIWGCVDGGG